MGKKVSKLRTLIKDIRYNFVMQLSAVHSFTDKKK